MISSVGELWCSLNRDNSSLWGFTRIWNEQGIIQGTHCRESEDAAMTPAEMEEMRSMLLI